MKRFLERGGHWVTVQLMLLAGVAAGVWVPPWWPANGWLRAAGGLLLFTGAVLAAAGARALGANLTPLPKPAPRSELVRHGVYRYLRHPLYTAVFAAALGWALLWRSWLALGFALALIPFFLAKAKQEEKWLLSRHPAYEEYRARTAGFVPWVY